MAEDGHRQMKALDRSGSHLYRIKAICNLHTYARGALPQSVQYPPNCDIIKDSKKGDPCSTLGEASKAKCGKHKSLGAYSDPVIILAGGLIEKETAKIYKSL